MHHVKKAPSTGKRRTDSELIQIHQYDRTKKFENIVDKKQKQDTHKKNTSHKEKPFTHNHSTIKSEASMRSSYFLPICFVLATLTLGCAAESIQGQPRQFGKINNRLQAQVQKNLGLDVDNNDTIMRMYMTCTGEEDSSNTTVNSNNISFNNATKTTPDSPSGSNRERDSGSRNSCRNNLVGKLIILIDLQYNQFRADIYNNNASSSLFSDLAIFGLGAAGAATRVSATQSLLAALSGGIAAARVSFSKSYLFDQTMPALISQMDKDRAKIRERITKNWDADLQTYPVQQAISDVNDYFYAGTLPSAIKNLVSPDTNKTQTNSAETQSKIENSKIELMSKLSGMSKELQAKFCALVLDKNKIINSRADDIPGLSDNFKFSDIGKASQNDIDNMKIYIFKNIKDENTLNRIKDTVNSLNFGLSETAAAKHVARK